VADAYDSLVDYSHGRKGLTPSEAKQEIIKYTRTHFDPRVTKAFSSIFPSLEVGVPFLAESMHSQPT